MGHYSCETPVVEIGQASHSRELSSSVDEHAWVAGGLVLSLPPWQGFLQSCFGDQSNLFTVASCSFI